MDVSCNPGQSINECNNMYILNNIVVQITHYLAYVLETILFMCKLSNFVYIKAY